MPVYKCESNGKYRIGDGECIYDTKEKAEEAMRAMYAQKNTETENICKSFDEDKRLFTSIVLKSEYRDDDGNYQDYWPEEVVQEAAHDFILNCMQGNISHSVNTDAVKFVESYIAPVDFEMGGGVVNKGDWVATVKIFDDELWSLCKQGLFKGFSVGCQAVMDVEETEE